MTHLYIALLDIVNIESAGMMSPDDLFVESIKVLMGKCADLKRALDEGGLRV